MNTPYYADEQVQLYAGDCLEVLAGLPDSSVDSVVCDPPYSLSFMSANWDTHATPEQFQSWCELWATECLRVLKPGGHILAFGGTRTWHRLACAVEDAGFEIRDSIAWLYGSGFPKSLDVRKAIDKAAGAEREVVGTEQNWGASTAAEGKQAYGDYAGGWNVTAPATDAAKRWQGWGTALKPAFEPVVVARKPLSGTVAANVLAYGTGALNVDGCRIHADDAQAGRTRHGGGIPGNGSSYELPDVRPESPAGRWPPNVLLDEHFEPILRLNTDIPTDVERLIREFFRGPLGRGTSQDARRSRAGDIPATCRESRTKGTPLDVLRRDCPPGWLDYFAVVGTRREGQADALDRESGNCPSGIAVQRNGGGGKIFGADNRRGAVPDAGYTDSGGASRFFPTFHYTAKAPGIERPSYHRSSCECEDSWPTTSPVRATAETATPQPGSSTSKSGNATTADQSQTATKSTTSTSTSSTTAPTICSPSPLPSTSDSTRDASCARESGLSPAESASSSSLLTSETGTSAAKAGRSMAAADRATSQKWSKTSVCGNCGAPARLEAHATVKPVELMRWLIRLVTPPNGVVLDPFAGSGTTGEAAIHEHKRCILIEREPTYLPLIVARIHKPMQVGFDFEGIA